MQDTFLERRVCPAPAGHPSQEGPLRPSVDYYRLVFATDALFGYHLPIIILSPSLHKASSSSPQLPISPHFPLATVQRRPDLAFAASTPSTSRLADEIRRHQVRLEWRRTL